MMRKIYSVDRFEGDFAVAVCDDGTTLEIKREALGTLLERDVFSAMEECGELSDIIPMPEEREKRLAAAMEKLKRFKSNS